MRRFASGLLFALTSTAALADGASLARCRSIPDSAQRLACYDALPAPAADKPAPEEKRQAPAQFGLEHKAVEQQLQSIESHVEGRFDGWAPNDRIRFANGQVWQIVDGSRAALNAVNPKVRVRRGVLGAFYLEVEGTNHSPRVRRVQ